MSVRFIKKMEQEYPLVLAETQVNLFYTEALDAYQNLADEGDHEFLVRN